MKKINLSIFTGLFLLLLLLSICPLYNLQNEAHAAIGKQAFQQNPKDGLRDCFLRFQDDMINYEQGDLKNPEDVFDLLQRPEYINVDREFSYLLKAAKRLFLITQSLIFDYETDIPDAPSDSDTADVTLYTEDRNPLTFTLVKNPNGKWVFSSKTLDDKEILAHYKKIQQRFEKLTRVDMEGDTYNPQLMSPYRTMLTLRAGVMGLYGLTLEDAAKTIDLSEIEPVLQEDLGETLAVRLYRVLHFESPLDVEQISANPTTETIPVFLVEPGFGAISMHVVTDENNIKSWKFTPKSLDVVWATYDENIKNIQDEGDNPFLGTNLPLDILIDDLVQKRFPTLENELLGIDYWKYITFIILVLLTPLLLWIIRFTSRWLMNFLRHRSKGALNDVSNQQVALPLMTVSATYLWTFGFLFLITSEDGSGKIMVALNVILILAEVWVMSTMVWIAAHWISSRTSSRTAGTVALVIGQILKIIIIIAGIVNIASIFGQDSTRVVAALGIGGVAIALAGKNTVENIFGTMMIITTRPFAIGHFIIIDDIEGEVEHVGLRSTTIRTFYNSLVTVPNSHFITSPVDNMGKREFRRFKTTLGVAYDTPPDKMVAFTEGLREIVLNVPQIDKDRIYIRIYDFGPSSIDILVYLHIHASNRHEELIIRERLILDTIHLSKMLDVEFAFPTRTLFMRNEENPSHEEMGGERRGAALGREAASLLLNKQKEDAGKRKIIPGDDMQKETGEIENNDVE